MDPNLYPRDHQRRFEAIDTQINSLKESFREPLRALSQRRNEFAPISSLPTEIITDIFLLASASAKRDYLGLAWLNVARPSSMARDCTQSTPLLESHRLYLRNLGRHG